MTECHTEFVIVRWEIGVIDAWNFVTIMKRYFPMRSLTVQKRSSVNFTATLIGHVVSMMNMACESWNHPRTVIKCRLAGIVDSSDCLIIRMLFLISINRELVTTDFSYASKPESQYHYSPGTYLKSLMKHLKIQYRERRITDDDYGLAQRVNGKK